MSQPPMITHRVTYEKSGFNTIIKIQTIEDLNDCIDSKEIELDPEELRQILKLHNFVKIFKKITP